MNIYEGSWSNKAALNNIKCYKMMSKAFWAQLEKQEWTLKQHSMDFYTDIAVLADQQKIIFSNSVQTQVNV